MPTPYSTCSPLAVIKRTVRIGSIASRRSMDAGITESAAPVSTTASTVSDWPVSGLLTCKGTRKMPILRLAPVLPVVFVGAVGDGGVGAVLGDFGGVP